MPCSWEGNRRTGVALAVHHRLQWFIQLRPHGLRKGDEHPASTPREVWLTLPLPMHVLHTCHLCCFCCCWKFNRWRTVVSGTWKYDDPRLNMSHEGAARVWHLQPRVVLFPCPTNNCVSYVLSSDQLQEFWIICKLKSFSPLYLHDLNTQARRVIFGVSEMLCDFGHKNSFKEE